MIFSWTGNRGGQGSAHNFARAPGRRTGGWPRGRARAADLRGGESKHLWALPKKQNLSKKEERERERERERESERERERSKALEFVFA